MNRKPTLLPALFLCLSNFVPLTHAMLRYKEPELEIKEKHDHALGESNTIQEDNVTWLSKNSQRHYPLRGLYNNDNRCYLNASLQALFITPCFYVFIDYPNYEEYSVGKALQRFAARYLSQNTGVFFSDEVKRALAQLYTDGNFQLNVADNHQEDAAEVLGKMLAVITPDLANPQTNPFCIQEIAEFRCRECNEIYEKELDNYKFSTIITVPLTSDSLHGCIDEYFFGLVGKRCCKQYDTQHTKKSKLKNAPPILCIALNRFSYTQDGGCKKNNTVVSFPTYNLDMRAFTDQDDATARYDLTACIVHHGPDIHHGHYVAYIRRDNQWYLCNDKDITQMPRIFDINKDLCHNENEVAYIFMYEKQGAARELERAKKDPKIYDKKPDKPSISNSNSLKAFFFGSSQRAILSLGFVAAVGMIFHKFFKKN